MNTALTPTPQARRSLHVAPTPTSTQQQARVPFMVRGIGPRSEPWDVDRWGRLLSGLGTVAFSTMAIVFHPLWILGVLAVSAQLIITALVNRCPLHDALVRAGALEREALRLPSGQVRPEWSERLK